MQFITSKMLYEHTNHKEMRSIVNESLVHSHSGQEFEPRHRTLFFVFLFSIIYY